MVSITSLINLGLGEAAKLPAASGSLSANGWCKIPLTKGYTLILQWGQAEIKAQGQVAMLPIAFPAGMLQVVSCDSGGGAYSVGVTATGNTGITFRIDGLRYQDGVSVVCRYISIGF
jgi:hypothetical protein